jgi:hypothetical protein
MKESILAFFLIRQARRRGTADCSPPDRSNPCHFRQQGGKTLALSRKILTTEEHGVFVTNPGLFLCISVKLADFTGFEQPKHEYMNSKTLRKDNCQE